MMRRKFLRNLLVLIILALASGQAQIAAAEDFAIPPALSWEKIETSTMPSPRNGFAMTLLEPNGVALFFGGFDLFVQPTNEMWLTNGRQWLEMQTPHRPPERAYASLAYDPFRQEAVLFGGGATENGLIAYLNDTWTYNGIDWSKRTPQNAPSPRMEASMVYDPGQQRTILFGGSFNEGEEIWKYNDTWAWDGSNWEQMQVDTRPHGRDNSAMIYDPVHQYILLYGGDNIAAHLNDTWTWDGTTWTEKHPNQQPSIYFHDPQMAFDQSRSQVVLVGSVLSYPNGHAETWTWNGQDWVPIPVFHELPYELMYNGKLMYFPKLQTVAMVYTRYEKFINPDGSMFFIERTEVWALVNTNIQYMPLISQQ